MEQNDGKRRGEPCRSSCRALKSGTVSLPSPALEDEVVAAQSTGQLIVPDTADDGLIARAAGYLVVAGLRISVTN
jgi:hypothetical protein